MGAILVDDNLKALGIGVSHRNDMNKKGKKSYCRIMLFGRPGSGKSTSAIALHKALGIPLYHLDKYFFVEHWVERDYQEFLALQRQMVDQSKWIIDGNNTKSIEMRWERADIVLYFNFPRWLCYWRIFKRLFSKDPHIDDRAEKCPETIRWSLLKYMWTFNQRVTKPIKKLRSKYPQSAFYEIRNNNELKKVSKQLLSDII